MPRFVRRCCTTSACALGRKPWWASMPTMDRQTKWTGWFATLIGAGLLIVGASDLLFGRGDLPSGLSCRAVCGWSLVSSALFGDEAGSGLFAVLTLVLGATSTAVGIKLLKNR